jgi:pyruvate-formate lyase
MNLHALVQMHFNDTANAEMMLKNYIESLEEENDELRDELKAAITDKRAAVRKSEKDRKLAKSRLDEWDAERLLRRELKIMRLNKRRRTRL